MEIEVKRFMTLIENRFTGLWTSPVKPCKATCHGRKHLIPCLLIFSHTQPIEIKTYSKPYNGCIEKQGLFRLYDHSANFMF